MAAHLPVKLRKTPGGFRIECGDKRASLFIYVDRDELRVDSRFLHPPEAEEFAKAVARALRQSWVIAAKHGGG